MSLVVINAPDGLRVRSGPSRDFRVLLKLSQGTDVHVHERHRNAVGEEWAWVVPGDGWVHTGFLGEPASPGWRPAKSITRLLHQVNAIAPSRAKTNDGTIGDAAHQATKSDHNPNALGVVTAVDITHDPARGMDCADLVNDLVASRDPRIKYIIFRGQILSSKVAPWTWRPYSGLNAHMKHAHISVDPRPELYDDETPWRI